MKVSFDCRDIVFDDPVMHAGVYDLPEKHGVYASLGNTLGEVKYYPPGETKRWIAGYNLVNSVDDLNRMFGKCFMAGIGDSEKLPKITDPVKIPGCLYRQKRKKPKSLLMHIKTWHHIRAISELKTNQTFWSYKAPWIKFFDWIYELDVVSLNDYIIPGVVIGLGYPEDVGVVTRDGSWIDPIGMGINTETITAIYLEGNYADI